MVVVLADILITERIPSPPPLLLLLTVDINLTLSQAYFLSDQTAPPAHLLTSLLLNCVIRAFCGQPDTNAERLHTTWWQLRQCCY